MAIIMHSDKTSLKKHNVASQVKNQMIIDVVGMTSGVCQGQRCLPAGVLGVSTMPSKEDRLWLKGRLRQQPAGDSTEESQSRAMKIRSLQRLYRRKWPCPDKINRGKGRE
jgi:hypothetical protein